jgi:hypothetical protein
MPWEQRGGTFYYYRKRRIGSRVVSEYVGAGAAAQLTAVHDELGRDLRRVHWEGHQAFIHLVEEVDETLDVFDKAVSSCLEFALYALGFHLHKSTWRRSRMSTSLFKAGHDPADA